MVCMLSDETIQPGAVRCPAHEAMHVLVELWDD